MPTHTITRRPATDDEMIVITARAKFGCLSTILLVVFLGGLPAILIPPVCQWVGGLLGQIFAGYGWWFGLGISLILIVLSTRNFIRRERERLERARLDHAAQLVEEFSIENPASIELSQPRLSLKTIVIDIGQDRLLLLNGLALVDSGLYGAEVLHEPVEGHFNLQPDPYAFPSERFTLIRLPNSGDVLKIIPSGSYVAPIQHAPMDDPLDANARESALLSGDLASLPEAITATDLDSRRLSFNSVE